MLHDWAFEACQVIAARNLCVLDGLLTLSEDQE